MTKILSNNECPFCNKDEKCPGQHELLDTINMTNLELESKGLVRIQKYKIAMNVVQAALRLYHSGYDGPWIGPVCEDLYSSLCEYENYDEWVHEPLTAEEKLIMEDAAKWAEMNK